MESFESRKCDSSLLRGQIGGQWQKQRLEQWEKDAAVQASLRVPSVPTLERNARLPLRGLYEIVLRHLCLGDSVPQKSPRGSGPLGSLSPLPRKQAFSSWCPHQSQVCPTCVLFRLFQSLRARRCVGWSSAEGSAIDARSDQREALEAPIIKLRQARSLFPPSYTPTFSPRSALSW